MSDMGGLKEKMPTTFWTMLIGSLALAGIFPLAGFWSKDALLVAASPRPSTVALRRVRRSRPSLTAFYTTRMVLLTFFGDYRGHAHPHESPRTMAGPLMVPSRPRRSSSGSSARRNSARCLSASGCTSDVEAEHFVAWIAALGTVAALAGIASRFALYRQ